MNQTVSAYELFLRTLPKGERSFILAEGVKATIPVVTLVENASYLTCKDWGKDEEDKALVRRGAGLRRNLDTTRRAKRDDTDLDQQMYAKHNKGIYSLLRRELHVVNGEKKDRELVKGDLGMFRIAGILAQLVRAKDPASQEAYMSAIRLPASTSPFTTNENKLQGAKMAAAATSIVDSLGRINPGRLIMLIATAIPANEARIGENNGIIVCVDYSVEACANYIDAVIGITYVCLGHVVAFRNDVMQGKTRDEPNRRELAARMRAFGALLGDIDALPFRHAFKHTALELCAAADLIEKGDMKQAAAILAVTQQSMMLQLKLNELQEQSAIFSFWEKEVMAPTEKQLALADHELSRLSKEILAIDETGFKRHVKEDISARVELARECLVGRNYDQVYDSLEWSLQAQ